jgi:hypothetical protein
MYGSTTLPALATLGSVNSPGVVAPPQGLACLLHEWEGDLEEALLVQFVLQRTESVLVATWARVGQRQTVQEARMSAEGKACEYERERGEKRERARACAQDIPPWLARIDQPVVTTVPAFQTTPVGCTGSDFEPRSPCLVYIVSVIFDSPPPCTGLPPAMPQLSNTGAYPGARHGLWRNESSAELHSASML